MIYIENPVASTLLGVEKVYITFSIKDTYEDPSNYKFSLLRANFENGEYEVICDNIYDFECFDYSANLLNDDIAYFYKIKITSLESDDINYSEVFSINSRNGDNYTSYFGDIYSMYAKNVINNEKLYLLKKKKSGQICSCFDNIRNIARNSRCTTCYSTKYIGGYYDPVEVNVVYINPLNEHNRFEVSGVSSATPPLQLWMGNYPLVKPGDILVDSVDNTRYIVTNCQQSIKNRVLIRQTLQIDIIPRTDIIYRLDIKGD